MTVSKSLKCPYCKGPTEFTSSEIVYGKGRDYGMIYVCSNYPTCDAYVGSHKNSQEPLGYLANKETRKWRMKAHAVFDPKWKFGSRKRKRRKIAYEKMQAEMNLPPDKAHISMFDVEQCKFLIRSITNGWFE